MFKMSKIFCESKQLLFKKINHSWSVHSVDTFYLPLIFPFMPLMMNLNFVAVIVVSVAANTAIM